MDLAGNNDPVITLSDDYLIGIHYDLNRVFSREGVIVDIASQHTQDDCGHRLLHE